MTFRTSASRKHNGKAKLNTDKLDWLAVVVFILQKRINDDLRYNFVEESEGMYQDEQPNGRAIV